MFTAILVEASEKPSDTGLFSYAIVYTDGISIKYEKRYNTDQLTDDVIQRVASAEIAKLTAQQTGKREIQPGSEIPLLSAEQPDEAAGLAAQKLSDFVTKRRQLAGLKIAVAEGFIAADDKRLETLPAELAAAWEDRFIDFLSRS